MTSHTFVHSHRDLLESAVSAITHRAYWTPFSEIPSGAAYGDTAKADGLAAFNTLIGHSFDLPDHPATARAGREVSPYGLDLGITYPTAAAADLVAAAQRAGKALAAASVETRIGACLEILVRLNAQSFLIAHATQHTTGQAFPMAFQAGGPHAQDRGLEAVALAWQEQTRHAASALWVKPQGKAPPLSVDKHWTLRPAGVALTIGCNTFPTWNSYPGLFASLATGNPVIVKPHPGAVLPLAITVRIAREVLAQAGLPRDAILLAVDEPGAEITCDLATDPAVRLIDYTGSSAFGGWLRDHARQAQTFAEEAGINTVVIAATDDFAGLCSNLAFSLSLYSGQMCTAPGNIYIPADGIATDQGHKSFDAVVAGLVAAIDGLLSDPARAGNVCGRIANPATLARVAQAARDGRVIRPSAPLADDAGGQHSATPLLLRVEDGDPAAETECFGPITCVIPTADADRAIALAADLARRKGAITAAVYDTDPDRTLRAIDAFGAAGVNLSINLTGNLYVNQSAAFSDFHATGANPAANASLSDTAFVASRFRRVMWRRPTAPQL